MQLDNTSNCRALVEQDAPGALIIEDRRTEAKQIQFNKLVNENQFEVTSSNASRPVQLTLHLRKAGKQKYYVILASTNGSCPREYCFNRIFWEEPLKITSQPVFSPTFTEGALSFTPNSEADSEAEANAEPFNLSNPKRKPAKRRNELQSLGDYWLSDEAVEKQRYERIANNTIPRRTRAGSKAPAETNSPLETIVHSSAITTRKRRRIASKASRSTEEQADGSQDNEISARPKLGRGATPSLESLSASRRKRRMTRVIEESEDDDVLHNSRSFQGQDNDSVENAGSLQVQIEGVFNITESELTGQSRPLLRTKVLAFSGTSNPIMASSRTVETLGTKMTMKHSLTTISKLMEQPLTPLKKTSLALCRIDHPIMA